MPLKFSNIAVVGGTRFDSQKGAAFLKEKGIEATPINMSETPGEQSKLYLNPDLVFNRLMEKIGKEDFSEVIFYCNSLSFACDWENRFVGRLYEPTAYYKEILRTKGLEKLVVIVAEEKTKENFIKVVCRDKICDHEQLNVDSRLDLINQLEAAPEKDQLDIVRSEFENYHSEGFTKIVVGCTHLDNTALNDIAGMQIFQPGLMMLRDFVNDYFACK